MTRLRALHPSVKLWASLATTLCVALTLLLVGQFWLGAQSDFAASVVSSAVPEGGKNLFTTRDIDVGEADVVVVRGVSRTAIERSLASDQSALVDCSDAPVCIDHWSSTTMITLLLNFSNAQIPNSHILARVQAAIRDSSTRCQAEKYRTGAVGLDDGKVICLAPVGRLLIYRSLAT